MSSMGPDTGAEFFVPDGHFYDYQEFTRREKIMRFGKTAILTSVMLMLMTSMSHAADVAKIGLVDFQKVFEKSLAGKDAKAEINTQGKEMEANLKKKGAEIETLRKKLDKEAVLMDKGMRNDKEREFRIKVNDFKMLQKKYEGEIKNLQKSVLNRLKKDVLGIVEEIGKKEGYLMIMENVGVVYAPSSMNITDQVIQKYDASYKKK